MKDRLSIEYDIGEQDYSSESGGRMPFHASGGFFAHRTAQVCTLDCGEVSIEVLFPPPEALVTVRRGRALQPELPIIAASSHDAGNAALRKAGASAVCGKMEFDHIGGVIETVRRR